MASAGVCSFCGRTAADGARLIARVMNVVICQQCIALNAKILGVPRGSQNGTIDTLPGDRN